MKKHFLLAISLRKEVKDLIDLVAGRAYTIDGVTDVEASDVDARTGCLSLTGYQLRDALHFVAPDQIEEQLEQSVCIAERDNIKDEDGDKTLPPGLFAWLEEYPEEGVIQLDGEPIYKPEAQAVAAPVDRLSKEDLEGLKRQAIEKHNGEWLHHWGYMIEAEVLKRLGRS